MNLLTELEPVSLSRYSDLRLEVRCFLRDYRRDHGQPPWLESWEGFSVEFSRALGQQGWIGMTWPREYGGRERSALARHVVVEELLAAGAPVAAHWIADRQTGPHLLRHGTEAQRRRFLPQIARGDCYFCIGMSEPDAGSDLAAIRTRAEKTADGWRINGSKLWTTYAHRCHYMLLLCRTSPPQENRHAGMSQFIVDLALPGLTIRPIRNLAGEEHFCEVVFEDVVVDEEALVGVRGEGWQQVMGELSLERSAPDRFMSLQALLEALADLHTDTANPSSQAALGRLAAHLWTLTHMSRAVAAQLEAGQEPLLQSAIVKDLGTTFEQEIPEVVREALTVVEQARQSARLRQLEQYAILHAPSFSIRGGTREVLRGIIARGLGLR
jgi:alkylation response protein AidB-like acyl-CoA dehydrogenase